MMADEVHWALVSADAQLEEAANWCGAVGEAIYRTRIEELRQPITALLREWEERIGR